MRDDDMTLRDMHSRLSCWLGRKINRHRRGQQSWSFIAWTRTVPGSEFSEIRSSMYSGGRTVVIRHWDARTVSRRGGHPALVLTDERSSPDGIRDCCFYPEVIMSIQQDLRPACHRLPRKRTMSREWLERFSGPAVVDDSRRLVSGAVVTAPAIAESEDGAGCRQLILRHRSCH